MKPAPPIIAKHKIDALAAFGLDWLGWLLVIVLKLGAPRRSRTLRRLVQRAERYVDGIVFILAVARLNPRPRRLARHPISAPVGFRRITANRRLLLKHARIRDRRLNLHARVLGLLSALAHPERYIVRLIRRCRRGICATRVIICALQRYGAAQRRVRRQHLACASSATGCSTARPIWAAQPLVLRGVRELTTSVIPGLAKRESGTPGMAKHCVLVLGSRSRSARPE